MYQGVPLFGRHFRFVTILRATSDPRSVNTAIEFSKIRQALSLVEAHVNYIQRSPALPGSINPSQSTTRSPGTSRLKEESDLSESETIPGTRGQSIWGGLYAGPTSTVSHLTSVRLLRVNHSTEYPDQVMSCMYLLHAQFIGRQRWRGWCKYPATNTRRPPDIR